MAAGLFDLLAYLKEGQHPGNTQRLGFGITCNDAAVVVGQHHHRIAAHSRVEDGFAACVKSVAVDQREHD